jgi:hypothetical protein
MLTMLDIGIDKAVAYRIAGKITDTDMELATSVLQEKIAAYGDIFIYQEIESFKGIEFEAMVEKTKFFLKMGTSNIKRIAVVTHKDWMNKIIDLEGKLFKNIDMKAFLTEDKDSAIEFLRE